MAFSTFHGPSADSTLEISPASPMVTCILYIIISCSLELSMFRSLSLESCTCKYVHHHIGERLVNIFFSNCGVLVGSSKTCIFKSFVRLSYFGTCLYHSHEAVYIIIDSTHASPIGFYCSAFVEFCMTCLYYRGPLCCTHVANICQGSFIIYERTVVLFTCVQRSLGEFFTLSHSSL